MSTSSPYRAVALPEIVVTGGDAIRGYRVVQSLGAIKARAKIQEGVDAFAAADLALAEQVRMVGAQAVILRRYDWDDVHIVASGRAVRLQPL
jgi:hypothetical protein